MGSKKEEKNSKKKKIISLWSGKSPITMSVNHTTNLKIPF